jgi:hypothetical protein
LDTFKEAVSGAARLRVMVLLSTPLTCAAGMVLVTKPSVDEVTVQVKVHTAPAAMLPPV